MQVRPNRRPAMRRPQPITQRQPRDSLLVGLALIFILAIAIGLWGRLRHA